MRMLAVVVAFAAMSSAWAEDKNGQYGILTDTCGEYAKDRPVHFQEILATLYHNLGINTATATITDATGRPQYLTEHAAMKELI